MWFDGEWESTWRGVYGKELYELCVTLQPEVIVNNRLGARGGMEGLTGMEGYAGGYGGDYMTPEQEIPDAVDKGLDWETCMTMNDRWGYNMHDKNFKSTTDLLQKLSDIVSKNGNFLLNVGPRPDGTFPDESIQRLSEIGDWMDVNGEAIHGTVGSPFSELAWGRATQKFHDESTTLYLHVFDWPKDGRLVVPGLAGTVTGAKVLGGSDTTFTMGQGEVVIDIPTEMPNEHIGVIAIEVKGKPVVYEAPTIHAHADEFVNELELALTVGSEDLEIRYSLNDNRTNAVYTHPITIDETTTIHAQSYHGDTAVSSLVSRTVTKISPKKANLSSTFKMYNVQRQTYIGSWDELPDFSLLTPVKEEYVSSFTAPEGEFVAYVYEGYLFAPSNDMFMFALSSDDGSRFLIGDDVVIDNDGLHGTQEKRGSIALAKGWHKFKLEWFNKAGGASLDLRMGVIGSTLKSIPASSIALPE
jgi:alpha-L-fucosidase